MINRVGLLFFYTLACWWSFSFVDANFIELELEARSKGVMNVDANEVPVQNDFNIIYYVPVIIDGNKYSLMLSTEAPFTWVIGRYCKPKECGDHRSTFGGKLLNPKQPIEVTYTDGSRYSGFLAEAKFGIGDIVINNVKFGVVEEQLGVYLNDKYDGIFSLAFPSECAARSSAGATNILEALKPIEFTVNFQRNLKSGHKSWLLIGHNTTQHLGVQPVFHQVSTANGAWDIKLNNITLNGRSISQPVGATVATGTTYIYGPTKTVQVILNQIRHGKDGDELINCYKIGSLPTITFTIGRRDYKLSGEDYVRKFHSFGNATCYLGIVPHDCETWTLGIPFISKYYTTFRYDDAGAEIAFSKKGI